MTVKIQQSILGHCFFFFCFFNIFCQISKCLKTYQLNIIKKKQGKIWKRPSKRYQEFPEEVKNKNQQYDAGRHKTILDEEKYKLVEYRKEYDKVWKNKSIKACHK